MKTHPNTQAVLDAWRRLSDGQVNADSPETAEYPGLVGRLFVLSRVSDADYPFQRVGFSMERLFGRALAEHNFLTLWTEQDRHLVRAALAAANEGHGPSIIYARGETLTGRHVELEVSLAPLANSNGDTTRFLGLCQSLTPDDVLGGRPLRRLQALAVYPPAPPPREPAIRLVR